jgi:hypothetical protein
MRDSSVGIPWIGSGAIGNPAFMSAREVSIAVDMVLAFAGEMEMMSPVYVFIRRELSRELDR